MKSNELKQLRNQKLQEMEGLINLKDKENRNFSDEEKGSFDKLDEEIRNLDTQIEVAEKEEAYKARMAKTAPAIKTEKSNEKYSLVNHINQVRNGKLEGLYKEVQEAGETELRNSGLYQANEFSVAIPSSITRDLSVGGDSGAKGGQLVQTDKVGFLYEMMEGSLIEKLGVQVLNDLTNNVDMPKQSASGDAVWADENDTVSNINFQVGSVPLRPTRLAAPYAISNKLLVQSAAENIVRTELSRKIRKALDTKFVELLLANAGTIGVAVDTNGGALDYAKVLEMITKVGESSEDIALAKFLMNYKTWSSLKQLKKDAGSGTFVLENNLVDGFEYEATNYMPSNLTKGTGTGLSAMAFGDFTKTYLGNFGAMELVIDPYTLASQAKTKITSNTFHGFAFGYPEGISVVKDIIA
jgi:HK97 family phage major capsid protein